MTAPPSTLTPPPTSDRALHRLHRRYARTRDPACREALFRRYRPLALSLARKHRSAREPLDDLEQVAGIGLLKALDGYDPDRGRAFSSYAVPTITGELKRHFRDRTWAVHVPRGLQEAASRASSARERLAGELGRSPTVREIAAAEGMSDEELLEALQANDAYSISSLDEPQYDGDDDRLTTRGEAMLGGEDPGFDRAEERALLAAAMPRLDARATEILRLRFEEDLRQHEIGARVGVSQMQVSRVLRQSLALLRAALADAPGPVPITPVSSPRFARRPLACPRDADRAAGTLAPRAHQV